MFAGKSIASTFQQYKLSSHLNGLLTIDMSQPPFRPTTLFDALLSDPPYGVREGARKVGIREGKALPGPEYPKPENHIPMTMPYDLPEIMSDLLDFAAQHLHLHGRLAYWLPTFRPEYRDSDVPTHPSLTLVSNSEQALTRRWARRLIVMEKTAPYQPRTERTCHNVSHALLRTKLWFDTHGREDPDEPTQAPRADEVETR
eukprot:Colp12_sorted_trinity150504_noHs@16832